MAYLLHNRRTCNNQVADTRCECRHEHVLHDLLDLVNCDITDGFQHPRIVVIIYASDDAVNEVELACCRHRALFVLDIDD